MTTNEPKKPRKPHESPGCACSACAQWTGLRAFETARELIRAELEALVRSFSVEAVRAAELEAWAVLLPARMRE